MNSTNSSRTTRAQRQRIQQFSPEQLAHYQLGRLNQMFSTILPANRFYATKLGVEQLQLDSLETLSQLPLTTKDEFRGDNPAGFARNLSYPIDQYCRFHRTSGTHGDPMVVLDTAADWQWWLENWQYVLDAAEVSAADRVVMSFSFGPFIGFWSAFDAAVERGCLVAPTGAMTTLARLALIDSLQSTVMFCTPSYALHMAEVAVESKIDLQQTAVRAIIVAGEPGGSVPAIRDQIESSWNAKVFDHSGASEVGPWGFADPDGQGILVNEAGFIAEFLTLENGTPAANGQLSELVLTTLGRAGCPVIRYRTGDLVKPVRRTNAAAKVPGDRVSNFVLLEGGVLGRTDDMMIIRGVNVFPTSIEQILRNFPELAEYRMTAFKQGAMDQLKIEIEDRLEQPERVQEELQIRLGFRVEVESVPLGSLPRFEAKGKRFIDDR